LILISPIEKGDYYIDKICSTRDISEVTRDIFYVIIFKQSENYQENKFCYQVVTSLQNQMDLFLRLLMNKLLMGEKMVAN